MYLYLLMLNLVCIHLVPYSLLNVKHHDIHEFIDLGETNTSIFNQCRTLLIACIRSQCFGLMSDLVN